MYKKIMTFIIISALFMFSAFKVKAEEYDFHGDEIINALPSEVAENLDEMGIDPENSGALKISFTDIVTYFLDLFKNEVKRPLKMLTALSGIILISAIMETIRDGSGAGRTTLVFNMVSVIAGAGIISTYISESVALASAAITSAGTFLGTFIPIFAGVMAISGQITAATAFNAVTLVASQLISGIMVTLLTPLTGCILGVSVGGAVNPDIKLDRIAETLKKIIIWVLGFLITIFVGLLSVQGFLASSTDNIALKAAKFAVSSSVPIVGGAVSDALSTIKGSMSILKSSIGTFGIIAGVLLLVPNLVSILCYKLVLMIAGMICEVFGVTRISGLIKSGENIMTIAFAMLFSFAFLTVVSVGMMLSINGGVT